MPTHKQIIRHCQQANIGPYARVLRNRLAQAAAGPQVAEKTIHEKVRVTTLELTAGQDKTIPFGFMVDINDRNFRVYYKDPETGKESCSVYLELDDNGKYVTASDGDRKRLFSAVVASLSIEQSVNFTEEVARLRDGIAIPISYQSKNGSTELAPKPTRHRSFYYMDEDYPDLDHDVYVTGGIDIKEKNNRALAVYLQNKQVIFSFNTRGLRYVMICENYPIVGKEEFYGYGARKGGGRFSGKLNQIEANQALDYIMANMTDNQRAKYQIFVIKMREQVKRMPAMPDPIPVLTPAPSP